MKLNFARGAQWGAGWLLLGSTFPLPAGQPAGSAWRTVDIMQTNPTTRVVTNVIEVRVPENVFVDEYRTSRFQRTLTNVVEVPVTNWSTRTLTNVVPIRLVRTNVVERRQTNWATVTLTNWITSPATNVVEARAPLGAITAAAREPVAPPAPAAEVPRASFVPDTLVIEAARTAQPADSLGVEVNFKVRSSNHPELLLQVPQWRVERADRAVLISSPAQEFKRALPPGRYNVQVKARREAEGPLLVQQQVLEVTKDAVTHR